MRFSPSGDPLGIDTSYNIIFGDPDYEQSIVDTISSIDTDHGFGGSDISDQK
jgi:hypothetical protein